MSNMILMKSAIHPLLQIIFKIEFHVCFVLSVVLVYFHLSLLDFPQVLSRLLVHIHFLYDLK